MGNVMFQLGTVWLGKEILLEDRRFFVFVFELFYPLALSGVGLG